MRTTVRITFIPEIKLLPVEHHDVTRVDVDIWLYIVTTTKNVRYIYPLSHILSIVEFP